MTKSIVSIARAADPERFDRVRKASSAAVARYDRDEHAARICLTLDALKKETPRG